MAEADSPSPNEIGTLVALIERNRLTDAERGAGTLLQKHPGSGI